MKTVLTIIKKEFARFFKDTRLWITALILPGLLIFAMYSLMGTIIADIEEKETGGTSTAYVLNMPQSLSQSLGSAFTVNGDITEADAQAAVREGRAELLIVFPQDFDEAIKDYSPSLGTPAPNVRIYYNSAETKSLTAYSTATALLSAYEETLANKFDVNRPATENDLFDLADAQSTARTALAMVVPMVLLMLLFSGCMSVAPESIAGEKERGTIATLLVTPVKRGSVAIGKILALSAIALLSGLSSALGLVLSLPKLMGSAGGGLTLSMFGFGDIVAILAGIDQIGPHIAVFKGFQVNLLLFRLFPGLRAGSLLFLIHILHIGFGNVFRVSILLYTAALKQDHAVAEAVDGGNVMADKNDCMLVHELAHEAHALLGKKGVPHGQGLVNDHDVGIHMGDYRKSQAQGHAAGIVFYRLINKIAYIGKGGDGIESFVDFFLAQAQDRGIEQHVFAAREFGIEAAAQLQQGCHAAVDRDCAR